MANTVTQIKKGFLFQYQNISKFADIFELVEIIKTSKDFKVNYAELNSKELETHFDRLLPAQRAIFQSFYNSVFSNRLKQGNKGLNNAGVALMQQKAISKELLRFIWDALYKLSQNLENLSFYHHIINAKTSNQLLSPCTINPLIATTSFEVIKKTSGEFSLEVLIHLGLSVLPLSKLDQFEFILRSGNEIILLAYKDYLNLKWLKSRNPQKFGQDPGLFEEQIIVPLEKDYKVERNGLFKINTIECTPQLCITLSEVNDTFLIFTPKWKYEGIILDGDWKEKQELTVRGERYEVLRNKEIEEAFIQEIKALHPNFSKQFFGPYFVSFAEAKKNNWFLKIYHGFIERDVEILGLDMLRHFRYSPHVISTEFGIIQTEANRITLKLEVGYGSEKVSLSELQKLLWAGQKTIMLKDNSIGVIPEEWLDKYGLFLKHGQVLNKTLIIPQWMLLAIDNAEEIKVFKPVFSPEWWQKWRRYQDPENMVYPVPASISANLRGYQRKGFEWICLLSEIGAGACLADDMGLGKTLQTIAFIAHLNETNKNGKHLIICPATLQYNWLQEFEKFAPDLQISLYKDLNAGLQSFMQGESEIMIASYGAIRSDIEELRFLLWDTIVLDESQNIKNPSAQITRAVYQLNGRCRIALSGTPIMNNTFDLYSQLQFLLPGLFGSQEFFRKEYSTPIDRDGDQKKVQELRKITAPFVLRRTKKQVATDLPEKTETQLICEMGERQRLYYNSIKNQIRDSIFLSIKKEGLAKSKFGVLQGILKLRQICCSPVLNNDEQNDCTDSVKVEVLMEELKTNIKGHKALVFSQFKGMLHLIAAACEQAGIAYYHFDGDTPVQRRQELVTQFQAADNQVGVFLISLKSGNAGLNLTAADYVFLVDPWWNTAVQQQAIDRTHRIGQTKKVFAYQMICRDTIEERIVAIHQKKMNLSEELITEEDGFIKNLTEDDIAYLFD